MCKIQQQAGKILRPPGRISRRLVITARMNLNRLWTELEDVYATRTSSKLILLPELEDMETADQQNRLNEEKENMLLLKS